MRDIRKYEQLLQGPLTYEQFLTNRKYPNFQMIQNINKTLKLSHFALAQKVRIFLFSKPSSSLMFRISLCTKNDQFQYTIFYAEITKPSQKNSHIKFNGILFIVILAVCVHFRAHKQIM